VSIKVKGISSTMFALKRTGDRVHKGQLEYLDRASDRILKRAKEYAPVDEGHLEDALVKERIVDPTNNRRITIFVGVDPNDLGKGFTKYGHRYDEYVHEHLSPFGSGGFNGVTFSAGPGTLAKGPSAGGLFLQRAFEDFEDEIVDTMESIARRAIK
jgi:hypothetical protein